MKKNFFKLFGIAALVAVIGFSAAACKHDSGGGDDGGHVNLGGGISTPPTFHPGNDLKGGVWVDGTALRIQANIYELTPPSTFTLYSGSLFSVEAESLTGYDNNTPESLGPVGTVSAAGVLDITVPVPADNKLVTVNTLFHNSVPPGSIKTGGGVFVGTLEFGSPSPDYYIPLVYQVNGFDNYSEDYSEAYYMYSKGYVVINGEGTYERYTDEIWKLQVDLKLAPGWNSVQAIIDHTNKTDKQVSKAPPDDAKWMLDDN